MARTIDQIVGADLTGVFADYRVRLQSFSELISGMEIDALMKDHHAPDDLHYQESPFGYHLLWA